MPKFQIWKLMPELKMFLEKACFTSFRKYFDQVIGKLRVSFTRSHATIQRPFNSRVIRVRMSGWLYLKCRQQPMLHYLKQPNWSNCQPWPGPELPKVTQRKRHSESMCRAANQHRSIFGGCCWPFWLKHMRPLAHPSSGKAHLTQGRAGRDAGGNICLCLAVFSCSTKCVSSNSRLMKR